MVCRIANNTIETKQSYRDYGAGTNTWLGSLRGVVEE